MNTLLLQLAKEAGITSKSEDSIDPNYVKFAELIIRECEKSLFKWKDEPVPQNPSDADRWWVSRTQVMMLIRKHFGINNE